MYYIIDTNKGDNLVYKKDNFFILDKINIMQAGGT